MDASFELCYVDEHWAYFTTQPIAMQWGDDWNDAPYEHNAGRPYQWPEFIWQPDSPKIPNPKPRWEIRQVAFDGPFEQPCTWADGGNSGYSVQMINRGAVPWLKTDRFLLGGKTPHIQIWAGTPYPDFVRLVQSAGGTVYAPLPEIDNQPLEAIELR